MGHENCFKNDKNIKTICFVTISIILAPHTLMIAESRTEEQDMMVKRGGEPD